MGELAWSSPQLLPQILVFLHSAQTPDPEVQYFLLVRAVGPSAWSQSLVAAIQLKNPAFSRKLSLSQSQVYMDG